MSLASLDRVCTNVMHSAPKNEEPRKSPWFLAFIDRRLRLGRDGLRLFPLDLYGHFFRQLRRWQRYRDL